MKRLVVLHAIWLSGMTAVSLCFGAATGFLGFWRYLAILADVLAAYVPIIGYAAILSIVSRGAIEGETAPQELRSKAAIYLARLLLGCCLAILLVFLGYWADKPLVSPSLSGGGYAKVLPSLGLVIAFFTMVRVERVRVLLVHAAACIVLISVLILSR